MTGTDTQNPIRIYDTTLRDGSQRKGISFSLLDKLKVTTLLDAFGVAYIEGGWPGSNPKDCEYFEAAAKLDLKNAKICAFGSTRRAGRNVQEDGNLRALIDSQAPVVTLVGKASKFQVEKVLETSLDENLAMIRESVSWMKENGREVIFDAEHFFDGYRLDADYAISTLQAAVDGGADWLVLCDTNGGSLPSFISRVVVALSEKFSTPLGIHTHNDCELAVANTLAAVAMGCTQIQGTINGYGERCGNANLVSIIPNLVMKLGRAIEPEIKLEELTTISRRISEIANMVPNDAAPFVGSCAFSHKGGIHVAAVEKHPDSYEHISPESVGNRRSFVVSELSGRGNIRIRASELGLELNGAETQVLEKVKALESQGFQFENAEGTFELLILRAKDTYAPPFVVRDLMVVSEVRGENSQTVEAIVKVQIGDEVSHTVSEGDGPVDALDGALRKALIPHYPQLESVRLIDYKVRIIDPTEATAATTRVTIDATSPLGSWTTVGCSTNIIEASFQALADSYELMLVREGVKELQGKSVC
jgi:2-isopropylmalate synthase